MAGHRTLPHTADVAIEAWAPGKDECVAEAVRALIESFVDLPERVPAGSVAFTVEQTCPEDLLVSVLEEAIYQIDAHGQIPVDVSIDERTGPGDGSADVRFAIVPAESAHVIGAVPKAVALHALRFTRSGGHWHCHVTIDV